MVHEIKISFHGNSTPVFIPVAKEEANRVRELLVNRQEPIRFIESSSVFGQHVWLRFQRIAMVNFLMEPHGAILWDESDIAPSAQYPEEESSTLPDYGDIRWDVLIYMAGNPLPLRVSDCDGNDWVEITTSIDCDEQFIIINDDDGEDVAIPVASIDLVVGTEVARYTPRQIEQIQKATLPEELC